MCINGVDVLDVCVCTRFRTFPASMDVSDGLISDGSVRRSRVMIDWWRPMVWTFRTYVCAHVFGRFRVWTFSVRTFPASRDISDGPVSDGSVGHDPLTQIRELDADTERHE